MNTRRLFRESFFILLLLGVIVLLYFCLFGEDGYRRLREHRKQLDVLSFENRRLRLENETLFRNIKQLKSDPNEVERVARQDFNLARPGDIIVAIPEK